MRRRAFLALVGTTALAGCSDNGGGTQTGTETGASNFELVSIDSPDSTMLNVPQTFTIRIRNLGSSNRTFESAVSMRTNDGPWKERGTLQLSIPAGETKAWTSPEFSPRYLGNVQFRLAAFSSQWTIEVRPKRLTFGNFYATPTGFYLNVLGGSFQSEYPSSSNSAATDQTATPTPMTPSDGDRWVVMRVEVRNRLENPQAAPPASDFVLKLDGERRPQHQEISTDPYEGAELAGRTVRRGDLVYSVPAETEAADLTVEWQQSLPEGDVKAIWTT
ncbi:hypothetical protein ATH50_3558 [Haloplanus aerogenes]|uniref:DUF4352 domain-containing protein n=1 Tax=Haloplanus aerogenes TaxID=660522 RepID=A0A3M0CX13_9EURY|nr:hypothetical protein ATH50_3558 [Haloplanus aerogenes]